MIYVIGNYLEGGSEVYELQQENTSLVVELENGILYWDVLGAVWIYYCWAVPGWKSRVYVLS